jgi:hypothetical protein
MFDGKKPLSQMQPVPGSTELCLYAALPTDLAIPEKLPYWEEAILLEQDDALVPSDDEESK